MDCVLYERHLFRASRPYGQDEDPENHLKNRYDRYRLGHIRGESTAVFSDKYLAADGIENVIRVLDKIENDDLPRLDFIELDACPAGASAVS